MDTPKGSFAWYELMTTDVEAAGAFYSSVVGWSTTPVGSPEMPYTTFNVGGVGVAGLMTLPEGAGPTPGWIGYIHVPDVDAHVEAVVAAGGKLHKGPIDVPGMLRFAVVSDPQGTGFVLFTSAPRTPATPNEPESGSPGTVGWRELMTTDGAAAFDFYSSQFGWTKGRDHDMGQWGVYHIFQDGGVDNGGMMTMPPTSPKPTWNFYIQVESVSATVEAIKAGGGTVVSGPHPVPGGQWIVQGKDPQGAFFALVSNVA